MSSCKKDQNLCDIVDGLGKIVEEANCTKKISKEIDKVRKEMEAKNKKEIAEVRKEFIHLLKKVDRSKWVVGEYKWMPIGSEMPEGWVKINIGKGLTLIQGDKEGNSVGGLKKHFHIFEDSAKAYGIDNGGVLFYVDRPTNVETKSGEQSLFIKPGISKQRWISKTEVVGDSDANLAAGQFAELWQFQGIDYDKKCLEKRLEKYLEECLEDED